MNEALADSVMVLHAAFSMFVLCGLILLSLGSLLHWKWTGSRWFRWSHLLATLFVVARVWVGLPCPFSVIEDSLRIKGSGCVLSRGTHETLHRLAFRTESHGDFKTAVSVFGVLVLLVWMADAKLRRQTQ